MDEFKRAKLPAEIQELTREEFLRAAIHAIQAQFNNTSNLINLLCSETGASEEDIQLCGDLAADIVDMCVDKTDNQSHLIISISLAYAQAMSHAYNLLETRIKTDLMAGKDPEAGLRKNAMYQFESIKQTKGKVN